MKMKSLVLTILSFIAGFFFIILHGQASPLTDLILKALIIPPLIFVLLVNSKPVMDRIDLLMLTGLLMSWAGDVVLQFTFVPGLICFLLAQLMYLTAFYLTPGENTFRGKGLVLLIPVIVLGIGLVWFLYDDLGSMKIPVFLYAIVILTMLSGAINRFKKVNPASFWLVFAGAFLFVISDSAIAIDKFSVPFRSSTLVIMSTYVIAQVLIVTGYIRQYRDKLA
jgi:uncharacterized membrane protein YhhN